MVFRLAASYQRQQRGQPEHSLHEVLDLDEANAHSAEERRFLDDWKRQLFQRTWESLQRWEPQLHTVLRLRASLPGASADELATRVSEVEDRPVKPAWVHKKLHLARRRFADLFLDTIADTLNCPTFDAIEEELAGSQAAHLPFGDYAGRSPS